MSFQDEEKITEHMKSKEVKSDRDMCESRTLSLWQARDRCVTQKALSYTTRKLHKSRFYDCFGVRYIHIASKHTWYTIFLGATIVDLRS